MFYCLKHILSVSSINRHRQTHINIYIERERRAAELSILRYEGWGIKADAENNNDSWKHIFSPYSRAELLSWMNKYSTLETQTPCSLTEVCNICVFGGMKAVCWQMRVPREKDWIVVLNFWTQRAKQRSKLKVKPCRDLNLKDLCRRSRSPPKQLSVSLTGPFTGSVYIWQRSRYSTIKLIFYSSLSADRCFEISLRRFRGGLGLNCWI